MTCHPEKHAVSRRWFGAGTLAGLCLLMAGMIHAQDQLVLHGIGASTVARSPAGDPDRAHVGDTVTVSLRILSLDTLSHDQRITNIVLEVLQASPFTTGNLIPSLGGPFVLADFEDDTNITELATYVVQPDDPDVITHVVHVDSHDLGNNLLQEADPRASINVLRPCITITKECDYPDGKDYFPYSGPIRFKGTVCNTGNTTLRGIMVVDTPDGEVVSGSEMIEFAATTSEGREYDHTLQPGECIDYAGQYTPAGTGLELCGPFSDSIEAFGTDSLGLTVSSLTPCTEAGVGSLGARQAVTRMCDTACLPNICVTKEVACLLPGGVCGDYGHSAEGVKNSDCPTFCYRITVTNCGLDDLVDLTVVDDQISLASCNFPTSLAIGESVSCVVQAEQCDAIVNTVIASGVGAKSGIRTNAMDSALVSVKQAAINCEILLTSSFDMDDANCAENVPPNEPNPCDNHLLLPDGFIGSIGFFATIHNSGSATLENIQIAGLPADCDPALPATLAPGDSFVVECSPVVSCPAGAEYSLTVTADASSENGRVCVWDQDGRQVYVATQCEALVECKPPVACRVTGGGKQYASADIQGAAEDEIPASLFPENADYVTHGGQVGAPFGEATPFTPNAPCIRGQWEHVRHGEDGRIGNFHSDYFDSLMCACLGCIDPVTGEILAPMILNTICNPDDRVCGPEPRRAPANAICFSGVGSWTDGKGKRGRENVVFRVYIEDRSEPGGSPPGRHHADDPPDVYSIQIWEINGNPDSKPNLELREAVACATIADGINVPEAALAIRPPDVNDSGALGRGNHQIHPSTKSQCPE